MTRTRGPVSGSYGSCTAPPVSDTLSRQRRHGSVLPPIWNATCALGRSTGEVNVYVYWLPETLSSGLALRYCVHGSTGSWMSALATLAGVAVAKKVYA
ncbi:hypothetical protein Phou_032820 [Phytohabitans houttuyneae]|uniref:Uncharacterized protein n=1 Tax=Phytohabitans houttuyneae TaxID=1076126 RepID=A0A6V8K1U9_9ACTN|nr:hypothetical protein Phou_032820 [Phytohabitans houttuyneae]